MSVVVRDTCFPRFSLVCCQKGALVSNSLAVVCIKRTSDVRHLTIFEDLGLFLADIKKSFA
jgi:hypothetical protein